MRVRKSGLCVHWTRGTLMCKSVYNNLSSSATHTDTPLLLLLMLLLLLQTTATHLSVMTSARTHYIMTLARRCHAYQCAAIVTYSTVHVPCSSAYSIVRSLQLRSVLISCFTVLQTLLIVCKFGRNVIFINV